MLFDDFKYYVEVFRSGVILNESTFNTVINEANAYINLLTRGNITDVTDEVKNAICGVCDVIYNRKLHDEINIISSESLGNHSVSYKCDKITTQERKKQMLDVAKLYLANTGLLYRGMS